VLQPELNRIGHLAEVARAWESARHGPLDYQAGRSDSKRAVAILCNALPHNAQPDAQYLADQIEGVEALAQDQPAGRGQCIATSHGAWYSCMPWTAKQNPSAASATPEVVTRSATRPNEKKNLVA
jgi:hypothetical protein